MSKVIKSAALATMKRPFRVSVEGNIGSGKSTCIKFFEKYPIVETHAEPLHEWRNVDGHNLLALMYNDIKKWSFPFQHYVHLTRTRIQVSRPEDPKVTVKIFERSVQNSRHCFVENAKKQNYLQGPEYEVLLGWFDYCAKSLDVSLDLILYLKTSPEVAYERILKRGRPEESEISLEYLKELHESHERWLNSTDIDCEVITIDANRNIESVMEDLEKYSYKILGGNYTN